MHMHGSLPKDTFVFGEFLGRTTITRVAKLHREQGNFGKHLKTPENTKCCMILEENLSNLFLFKTCCLLVSVLFE